MSIFASLLPINMEKHPLVLCVSQMVEDIKIPPGNQQLELEMGRLLRGVKNHKFVPGNKLSAELIPRSVIDGILIADLRGGKLNSDLDVTITQRFPLNLHGYKGPMDVESVFGQVPGARIDDGGNVQNQVVDTALILAFSNVRKLLEQQRKSIELVVASSGDPFGKLPNAMQERVRDVSRVFQLDVPGRIAVQTRWQDGAEHGTLGIASEARTTGNAVERLIKEQQAFREAFQRATCFVSSDALFRELNLHGEPDYCYVINASTAFRTQVADESYQRAVLLPMNDGETADVCRVLLERALDEKADRPPFPSPFKPNGYEVDELSLKVLDTSLDAFRTYLPFHRQLKRGSFAAPISFGPKGGLVVGVGQEDLACFTTIPNEQGEKRLLEDYCDPSLVVHDAEYEMGAGDAVAAMLTFFQTVDPQIYLGPIMEEQERSDRRFCNLTNTLFLSFLSRLVGNAAVRNRQTNLSNIRPDAFTALFVDVASEALKAARGMSNRVNEKPVSSQVERWGISTLVWKVGHVAFPSQ